MKQSSCNFGWRIGMTWDRKAERTKNFSKRKASKTKTKNKTYKRRESKEKEEWYDTKGWD